MKRKRYTEEQIIKALKEQEAGRKVDDICREYGIAQSTFYKWKSRFDGMEVNDAKRLRELEAENNRLKKLLAESMLDNATLKDVLSRKW